MDTRAMGHILAHQMDYQKPGPIRHALSTMLGNGENEPVLICRMLRRHVGLLSVEGEMHKQQVQCLLYPRRRAADSTTQRRVMVHHDCRQYFWTEN